MFGKTKALLTRLHRDDAGAMAVEKVLLIALIAIPLIVVLAIFRKTIESWFTQSQSGLQNNLPTGVTGG
jgi:Flp pilus assembly pilin Flp